MPSDCGQCGGVGAGGARTSSATASRRRGRARRRARRRHSAATRAESIPPEMPSDDLGEAVLLDVVAQAELERRVDLGLERAIGLELLARLGELARGVRSGRAAAGRVVQQRQIRTPDASCAGAVAQAAACCGRSAASRSRSQTSRSSTNSARARRPRPCGRRRTECRRRRARPGRRRRCRARRRRRCRGRACAEHLLALGALADVERRGGDVDDQLSRPAARARRGRRSRAPRCPRRSSGRRAARRIASSESVAARAEVAAARRRRRSWAGGACGRRLDAPASRAGQRSCKRACPARGTQRRRRDRGRPGPAPRAPCGRPRGSARRRSRSSGG